MDLDSGSGIHILQRANNNTECCSCVSLASYVPR